MEKGLRAFGFFIYQGLVWGGSGYVVFGLDHSGAWFVLTLLPSFMGLFGVVEMTRTTVGGATVTNIHQVRGGQP